MRSIGFEVVEQARFSSVKDSYFSQFALWWPVLFSTRSQATVRFKRRASLKMLGIPAIWQKWLLPTRSIQDGGTALPPRTQRRTKSGSTLLVRVEDVVLGLHG